jgi:hypothetical protein
VLYNLEYSAYFASADFTAASEFFIASFAYLARPSLILVNISFIGPSNFLSNKDTKS